MAIRKSKKGRAVLKGRWQVPTAPSPNRQSYAGAVVFWPLRPTIHHTHLIPAPFPIIQIIIAQTKSKA
jgi:hypothetical protein